MSRHYPEIFVDLIVTLITIFSALWALSICSFCWPAFSKGQFHMSIEQYDFLHCFFFFKCQCFGVKYFVRERRRKQASLNKLLYTRIFGCVFKHRYWQLACVPIKARLVLSNLNRKGGTFLLLLLKVKFSSRKPRTSVNAKFSSRMSSGGIVRVQSTTI